MKEFGVGWISGCYGLKYPAVLVAAEAVIYRLWNDTLEILIGVRGQGRWEGGLYTVAPGGFVDPGDSSPQETARREIREELGVEIEVETESFFQRGPRQFRHRWDSRLQKAVNTGELTQEVPVIANAYMSRWVSCEPHSTDEVESPKWVSVAKLVQIDRVYCFDQARTLEHALTVFRKRNLL